MVRIEVIGLGPAGAELMTVEASSLWESAPCRYLRTNRHPAVGSIGSADSFDHLYEAADSFAEVYEGIVAALVAETTRRGSVLYAVPGSPVVAETTVALLLAAATEQEDLEVVIHPAMSFLDLAWARLGVDPVELSVRILDGHRFDSARPAEGGAVLVAQCESRQRLSDIKLCLDEPPESQVVLLARLGLPDEQILAVDWADIDRTIEADHLTSLWIPQLPPTASSRT